MSFPARFPPMRPQIELQRIHDVLGAVLADPQLRDAVVPREYVAPLMMAADCLCWCLHHDTGTHPDSRAAHFADIVHWLQQDLAEMGYVWDAPSREYIIEE